MTASVGNESELSGASSCAYRSSPESSQYPPYSPDYPQSVFSSDGSFPPPPSNHVLSHIDSPKSNHSKPACGTTTTTAAVLHHPPNVQLSHAMTPLTQQLKQVIPVIPVMPMKQATPTHQIQASGGYPHHLIHGQPIHGDNYGMHARASHEHLGRQPHDIVEGRPSVIVGNEYGTPQFPQYNYGPGTNFSCNEGVNPSNMFPNPNADRMGMTFVKTEPMSPPYYTPPYISGNPTPQPQPQPQGTAAIFTGPHHYLEGRGIHQQSVGVQMFTASATGKGKMCHFCLIVIILILSMTH